MNHRKEVMEECERLGIGAAIDAAESLVAKVRREVGTSGYGVRPAADEATSLSDEVITALAKGLVPFLQEIIAEAVTPLKERIAELEATQLTDGGVWDEATAYPPGRVVTCDGSAWVARQLNSHAKPGSSGVWRLLVSRGRNGRDAKGAR